MFDERRLRKKTLERRREATGVAFAVNTLCVLKHFPLVQTSLPARLGATLMHYGDAILSTWKYLRPVNHNRSSTSLVLGGAITLFSYHPMCSVFSKACTKS
ncbi:hypothetical protein DPEC_G00006230 [Dallia pectoralis]|uniref:Uncharacterized protein n=1 Tax=Dallia pectoralis TaxID=75939 RepID=A0ACC2HLJ3_DALPE|nr:hypothetical protein DPEC_G00006230 [Dallia pectoralis]